jgi:hypothetical protein
MHDSNLFPFTGTIRTRELEEMLNRDSGFHPHPTKAYPIHGVVLLPDSVTVTSAILRRCLQLSSSGPDDRDSFSFLST